MELSHDGNGAGVNAQAALPVRSEFSVYCHDSYVAYRHADQVLQFPVHR